MRRCPDGADFLCYLSALQKQEQKNIDATLVLVSRSSRLTLFDTAGW
jgi:hypothetical protein